MRKSKKKRQSKGEPKIATTTEEGQGTHQQSVAPSNPDALSRAAPKSKKSASPSSDEVRRRIAAGHRHGSRRPLELLARAEADLESHSAALANFSSPERERRGSDLLSYQLSRAVNTNSVPNVMAPNLKADTVALFSALNSRDPVESIFNRLVVAMTNSVMECHVRAVQTSNLSALDTNLRLATKGTRAIIDLVEARERRRSPKNIVVGNFNVNAGGQAMVGNFKMPPKDRSKRQTRTGSSFGDNQETGD